MSTRTIVETKIEGKKLTIKGLPVLTDPRFKEEYVQVGTFFCKATPIDLELQIGDTIKIANQLRTWKLDAIKVNKYGKSVAYFNKYNDRGNRMDTFYMVDGVKYLFAMTSGAARNGVVHRYREPKTDLERLFSSQGWSLRGIETVDVINHSAYDGGRWCHHMTDASSKYWYYYEADGTRTHITEGSFVEKSSNQYHIGCMESPQIDKIEGGTYLIELKNTPYRSYCTLYKTKDADEVNIIATIEKMLERINK